MSAMGWQALGELGAALLGGAVIGAERSFHGRAAGFRTHALVCLAAAAAILVSAAPAFSGGYPSTTPRLDPTRLAQGVMTGIGFLGAGVIFKEGVNVQGLTTAASIWATAAVGLLFGAGAFPLASATVVGILIVLVALRWVERAMPVQGYAFSELRFRSEQAPDKAELHAMLATFDVSLRDVSYARESQGAIIAFSGNLVAPKDSDLDKLATHLRSLDALVEFSLDRFNK